MSEGLRILVADDEAPARDELAYLLGRDDRVARVHTAADGAEALRVLRTDPVDAVFCDIRMPGLDGIELAAVLRQFAAPPPVVFVTAYDDHAVEAFDLRAVDYLLKPVRDDRLADAVGRVLDALATGPGRGPAAPPGPAGPPSPTGEAAGPDGPPAPGAPAPRPDRPAEDEQIAVELGGVTRFVRRSEVRYVEAHGDYARLVTSSGRHLVRVPLWSLEQAWADHGFVRIHRRWLVALGAIEEVRVEGGRMSVRVGEDVLEVSRRHTRTLRDRLVRASRPRPDRSPGGRP